MELVVFISNIFSDYQLKSYKEIQDNLIETQHLIWLSPGGAFDTSLLESNRIKYHTYDENLVFDTTCKAKAINLGPLYDDIYRTYGDVYDHYWFIENDVMINSIDKSNSFKKIFEYYKDTNYDVICSNIYKYSENQLIRDRWSMDIINFGNKNKDELYDQLIFGFMTMCRISNRVFKHAIEEQYKDSWFEFKYTTIANMCSYDVHQMNDDHFVEFDNLYIENHKHWFLNSGTNSYNKATYPKTATHDNILIEAPLDTIVHPIKEKNIELSDFEHTLYRKSNELSIWVCGNDFNIIPDYISNPSFIKYDMSQEFNQYNINEYNKILSEFVAWYYVYTNNIYSKYIGTAHYSRYPKYDHIDFDRIKNGEIQYFFCKYYNIDPNHFQHKEFAALESQINEFFPGYMEPHSILIDDLSDFLSTQTFINKDKITQITSQSSYRLIQREIFIMSWEQFNEMMTFIKMYLDYISLKYNLRNVNDWKKHVKEKIINVYIKHYDYCSKYFGLMCYKPETFHTIFENDNGFGKSNCWRVYSYMIEMLISLYIQTQPNFFIEHSSISV